MSAGRGSSEERCTKVITYTPDFNAIFPNSRNMSYMVPCTGCADCTRPAYLLSNINDCNYIDPRPWTRPRLDYTRPTLLARSMQNLEAVVSQIRPNIAPRTSNTIHYSQSPTRMPQTAHAASQHPIITSSHIAIPRTNPTPHPTSTPHPTPSPHPISTPHPTPSPHPIQTSCHIQQHRSISLPRPIPTPQANPTLQSILQQIPHSQPIPKQKLSKETQVEKTECHNKGCQFIGVEVAHRYVSAIPVLQDASTQTDPVCIDGPSVNHTEAKSYQDRACSPIIFPPLEIPVRKKFTAKRRKCDVANCQSEDVFNSVSTNSDNNKQNHKDSEDYDDIEIEVLE